MTLVKTFLVLVLAIFDMGSTATSAISQNSPPDRSIVLEYRSQCVFSFKDSVSMYRLSEIGIYKFCDGMRPQTGVTVELHGIVTSQREAKWRFCASSGFPRSSNCPDGQTAANTMGIDYQVVRPQTEVAISVGASTQASRDGFAFAWIADVGCDAALPSSACDIVFLPGATLTFSADAAK